MKLVRAALVVVPALVPVACAGGPPSPAALDTKNEACAFCRMAVSDARFAGQLVAPGEEPTFFDDAGCLGNYVREASALPKDAIAYVADHRTKAWVRASAAVFTKVTALQTPMGSHVIAHTDQASRDADPDAKGGAPTEATSVFGPSGPPNGAK